MKLFIFNLILISLVTGYVRHTCSPNSDVLSSYFLDRNVQIDNITTRDKFYVNFKIKDINGWPEKMTILIVNHERDDTIFRYQPYNAEIVQDNSRIKVNHMAKQHFVNFTMSFIKNLDDESRWKMILQKTEYDLSPSELCDIFIRSDQTPFVTIETKVLGKGKTIINKFNENDKIKVTCTLNKSNPKTKNPPFQLYFPDGSEIVKDTSNTDPDKTSMIITLRPNILNKIIYCFVNGGDNATDKDTLNFNLNKVYEKKTGQTTVAISFAVLICILLLVITIVGAYLLIVKQRKDTTKQLVKHHTEATQLKSTNITNMSRLTRMSKFSKSSKLSRSIDNAAHESQIKVNKT